MSDLRSRQVAADFPSILTKLNHLSMQGVDASLQVHHGLANRSRRKICLQKRANNGGGVGGGLGDGEAEGGGGVGGRVGWFGGGGERGGWGERVDVGGWRSIYKKKKKR